MGNQIRRVEYLMPMQGQMAICSAMKDMCLHQGHRHLTAKTEAQAGTALPGLLVIVADQVVAVQDPLPELVPAVFQDLQGVQVEVL